MLIDRTSSSVEDQLSPELADLATGLFSKPNRDSEINDPHSIHNGYHFVDYRTAASPEGQDKAPSIIRQVVKSLITKKSLPGSPTKERALPTLLLYDDRGLDLFDKITYLPEYYLTQCEIEVLTTHMDGIAAQIPDDSDVIELGCGSLRKTKLILEHLDKHRKGVRYYAIDVMPHPLHQSLAALAPKLNNITLVALCGTYNEVLTYFQESARPKTILWLGSSIGNFHPSEATEFLSTIVRDVMVPGDSLVIGMDMKKDPDVIYRAYHDSAGVTDQFELNAISHVNEIFSKYNDHNASETNNAVEPLFEMSAFKYTGEYDERNGRHDAYIEATRITSIKWPYYLPRDAKQLTGSQNLHIKEKERIYIESSYKYDKGADKVLAKAIGLAHIVTWADSRDYYTLCCLRKPKTSLPNELSCKPSAGTTDYIHGFGPWDGPQARLLCILEANRGKSAVKGKLSPPSSVPTVREWEELWCFWDTLCLKVIPRDRLLDKPIDLRHPFIFYLGHIPAFADIHFTKAKSLELTEPKVFAQWFERGIDPNIEDPTICHDHSTVPDQWPPLKEILSYRDRVRDRIRSQIAKYESDTNAGVLVPADSARHMWMAFEHEAMHLETLLYMVLQMDPSTIHSPLPGPTILFPSPKKSNLCKSWLLYCGRKNVKFGLSGDSEHALGDTKIRNDHVFGWDNESPAITRDVPGFSIRTLPITNAEYLEFLYAVEKSNCIGDDWDLASLIPKSWVVITHDRHTPARDGSYDNSNNKTRELAVDYGVRTVVGTPSITKTRASEWPIFVSKRQADAYAQWCGKRLPTETEWTYAARTYHLANAASGLINAPAYKPEQEVDSYVEGILGQSAADLLYDPPAFDLFAPSDANIELSHWHPIPVTECQVNKQLPHATFIGNGWEWTSTQFCPYPGFEPSKMYPGYSADFFEDAENAGNDSTHYIIKGGSYATHSRIALRQTFRNWYQKGYPYVLATFRLCCDK